MEAAPAHAICHKCWPGRMEVNNEVIEAEATSRSSIGSDAVIFDPQSVPQHPPGRWGWEAAVPAESWQDPCT